MSVFIPIGYSHDPTRARMAKIVHNIYKQADRT